MSHYGEALKHLASILNKAQGVTCIGTEKQIDIGREVLKLRGILDEFQAIALREGETRRIADEVTYNSKRKNRPQWECALDVLAAPDGMRPIWLPELKDDVVRHVRHLEGAVELLQQERSL
jgi:hypothetical protein